MDYSFKFYSAMKKYILIAMLFFTTLVQAQQIEVLVIRYNEEVVSLRPLEFREHHPWGGVDILINPEKLTKEDVSVLLNKYGFILNREGLLKMPVTIHKGEFTYYYYIGGYEYKEIYKLPKFLTVEIELLGNNCF